MRTDGLIITHADQLEWLALPNRVKFKHNPFWRERTMSDEFYKSDGAPRMTNQEYDNTMRGVLFPQTPETEKHPSSTGTAETTCSECGHSTKHRIASWVKTSANGKRYMTISFSEPQEKKVTPELTGTAIGKEAEFDDSIPF